MTAPPTRPVLRRRLRWALPSLLLAAPSARAYSSSQAPRHAYLAAPSLHGRGEAMAVDIPDDDRTIGRRAFFRRGSAALVSMTTASAIRPPAAEAAPATPALGTPAPDFSLFNSREQLVTLDTLASKGQWTVLYFYPGAFTSGCTLEARRFQEDLPLYRDLNAQVVGVSVDSVEKNAEFCIKEGLDFFMLTDEGGKVSKAYGSSLSVPGFGTFSNRQTYIIDPEKNVRWAFVDVESRIPKHSGEVLEKLKQLQQQS